MLLTIAWLSSAIVGFSRSGKKQTIAATFQLTDAEATKFWPVYDQYSDEVSKLGDAKYALLKEYTNGFGSLSDDQA